MAKELYDLGEIPDLGVVPARMHAQLIREARFGEPVEAFRSEQVPVPMPGPRDVLVYVMAAGAGILMGKTRVPSLVGEGPG